MERTERIVLAGGSGLLGSLLSRSFAARGREVAVLTRSRPGSSGEGAVRRTWWDGRTLGDWTGELDGALALINLAGRSVDCRYHARNRRRILASRIESTRVLGEAVARCRRPPRVWLNSSTATIYKHSLDRDMDEATGEIGATAEAKDAFSIDVARAWEAAFEGAPAPATRKVAMRTAMVLTDGKNSVFPALRRLVRLGLGGSLAGGRQYVSWIHEEDLCVAVAWLIEREDLSGPVNLAAPRPLPFADAMRILRRLAGVPFGLPSPRWLLEVGAFFLRTETELVIKSRRVVPGRLVASGFRFRFEEIEPAFRDLLGRGSR